jgi:hypothetical protein
MTANIGDVIALIISVLAVVLLYARHVYWNLIIVSVKIKKDVVRYDSIMVMIVLAQLNIHQSKYLADLGKRKVKFLF